MFRISQKKKKKNPLYPVNPVRKMEIPILFNYRWLYELSS